MMYKKSKMVYADKMESCVHLVHYTVSSILCMFENLQNKVKKGSKIYVKLKFMTTIT